MSRSGNQKKKILLIERMMLRSDAEHPVSMKDMLDILAAENITAERKSIYDDLEELRGLGMDIVFQKSAPSGYYLREIGDCQELGKIQAAAVRKEIPEKALMQGDAAGEDAAIDETLDGAAMEVIVPENNSSEGVVFFKVQKGEYAALQLRCKKNLLPALRARYGENLTCKAEAEKRVLVEVNDIPGEQFYAWLLSMEGAVRLVKPKDEVKKLKKAIKKLTE